MKTQRLNITEQLLFNAHVCTLYLCWLLSCHYWSKHNPRDEVLVFQFYFSFLRQTPVSTTSFVVSNFQGSEINKILWNDQKQNKKLIMSSNYILLIIHWEEMPHWFVKVFDVSTPSLPNIFFFFILFFILYLSIFLQFH